MTSLYIKIGAIVALVAALFGFGWYGGSLSGKAAVARLQRDQAQITASAVLKERASAQATAKTDRQAETAHDHDLEAIPLHIRHDPVFVRVASTPSCPVSNTPQAAGLNPGRGSAVPGFGERDIRGAIEALKVKYETILADCRRLDAEWPR